MALAEVSADVRALQLPAMVLASVDTVSRVFQAPVLTLASVIAPTQLFQFPVLLLGSGSPCTTRWAQIVTIERLDGEVYRFTSLDRDLEYGGETYRSCDSLVPSASEAVSEVDAAGNMDLSGAVGDGDGAITLADLYAGRFDGATATAWRVAWAGEGTPRRLLKMTFGPVEMTQTGYKVEGLGDGAKLQQTPLIRPMQPGCRWEFGDRFCQVDLGPLTVSGTVDSGVGQREFTDAARAEPAGYFTRGKVTFTSGDNIGVTAEIKEHAAGGVFTLWPRLPFASLAGDQYDMVPGCTNIKASEGGCNGCTAWGNVLRYGGFDKVPGRDRRSAAADVR